MLFGEKGVGIDRIRLVTCSASDISRLNNTQIQNIIDYVNDRVHVISKTVTNGNDQSHVTENFENSEKILPIPLGSTPQITPAKADDNDLTDLKEEDFCGGEVLIANVLSTSQSYDRSYFRNKTLDQYPNLYREFSSENFDYYGITDETSCPLCKLGHDDEESIEGRYKAGSYFIKCEQREIEITA
jgi:hypothetical protein